MPSTFDLSTNLASFNAALSVSLVDKRGAKGSVRVPLQAGWLAAGGASLDTGVAEVDTILETLEALTNAAVHKVAIELYDTNEGALYNDADFSDMTSVLYVTGEHGAASVPFQLDIGCPVETVFSDTADTICNITDTGAAEDATLEAFRAAMDAHLPGGAVLKTAVRSERARRAPRAPDFIPTSA